MDKKKVIVDDDNFNDIDGFYTEIDMVLTKDLSWKTGHNLDAFNDLLRGGFGVHEYGEPIIITWKNTDKSRCDLGYKSTLRYYENMLQTCHPANIDYVRCLLNSSKQENGDTLFDIIIDIIKEHDNIDLILR